MRHIRVVWSAFALACLGCDFSPGLGEGYPPCVDGTCLRAGCECLGGQVCVPQDPGEGPEACQPLACEDGEPCDDGDACTQGESCSAGDCLGGEPIVCDDQDVCTQDLCDSALGCQYPPIPDPPPEGPPGHASCANSLDDDCDGATDLLDTGCRACAADLECDDLDDCTADSCVAAVCDNQQLTGVPCDDSDACTVGDACLAGWCAPGGELPDVDGDGFTDALCGGDDCDDALAAVNPGAFEGGPGATVCEDSADNDCDGAVDYADPSCQGGPPVGPLCSPEGWCWENPLPQGNDLLGVWGQGGQAWGVGPNGIVVRFDATGLALEPLDFFGDLHAIHGAESTLVATGGNRAFQWSGGGWVGVVFEQSVEAFFDVWVEGDGVFWLAGRQGAVWRYESNTGTPFSTPSSADILAVSVLDGVPWAADSQGARFRWSGNAWEQTVASADGTPFHDLAAYRSTGAEQRLEALAVGGGGRVDIYRDEEWINQLDIVPELYGLFWDPAAGGLAVGDGAVYLLDGPASDLWQEQSGGGEAYRGGWSQSGPNGLKDGVIAVGLRGALYGRAGTTVLSTTRLFTSDLHAVACAPGHTWMVGSGGRIAEIVVDGNGVVSWGVGQYLNGELRGVWGQEGGPAWVVGSGGQVVRLEEDTHFSESSGVAVTLRAVVGIPDAGGAAPVLWAVGDDGTVLQRKDGTWTRIPKVTSANLHALAAFGPEVWAVGDEGVVLRCTIGSCSLADSVMDVDGSLASLRAVVVLSQEAGYAGDEGGSIYRQDALGWGWLAQPAPGRAIRALTARYLEGAGWDVWAVGDRGLALNLSPIGMLGWHQVQIGANVDLHGLCTWVETNPNGNSSSLRAVGAGGAVLRVGF